MRALLTLLVSVSLSLAGVAADLTPAAATTTAPVQANGHHVLKARDSGRAASNTASGSGQLLYGGGSIMQATRVYIDFWGPAWSSGFSSQGYTSTQAQNYLETYFGNAGGSLWANVATQYCQGAGTGAASCPGGATFVTTPAAALAGVYNDPTAVSFPYPSPSTAAQNNANDTAIAQSVARAIASGFGGAYDPHGLYVVATPTCQNEPGFGSTSTATICGTTGQGWCAWHSGYYDASHRLVPFVNLPYEPDARGNCGVNSVNASDSFGHGIFDGFSIVGGHEYLESITDPDASTGWIDAAGYENGDKCAWDPSTPPANRTFGAYTFAIQPTYSNEISGCAYTRGGATAAPGVYHSLTPARIFDSRSAAAFGSGALRTLQIAGSAPGVPGTATAVVLNVGVTNTRGGASGFVQVLPSGGNPGSASTVNYLAGQTIANLTQVGLTGGAIDIYNSGATADVFIDLQGYYGPTTTAGAGLYNSLASPVRFMDTRIGQGGTRLGPGSVVPLQVWGQHGIPSDAQAIVFNLTEVSGTASSYLGAWPHGQAWPGNSNLNFPGGRVLANRAIVAVTDGFINITNSQGAVDVLVDVVGWYSGGAGADTTGKQFVASAPSRIFDTRSGQGGHGGPLGPGEVVFVQAPSGVSGAISLNVTVLDAATNSFLSVLPDRPAAVTTSDINFQPGDILPNLAITGVTANGSGGYQFVIYNSVGSVDVFIDVNGSYA